MQRFKTNIATRNVVLRTNMSFMVVAVQKEVHGKSERRENSRLRPGGS